MKKPGACSAETLACVNHLKTMLGRGIQSSKRGALYALLSEGLIWHDKWTGQDIARLRDEAAKSGDPVAIEHARSLVEPSTKDFHNVQRALNRALTADLVTDVHFDDDCFDDNRRRTVHFPGWKTRAEFDDLCKGLWKLDYWQNQPLRVEVWLEKDTTSFFVQGVTDRYRVPLRVSSGNFSRTFLSRIAKDISSTLVPIKILYIGDFDPSGIDIERAAKRGETKEEWIARRIKEGKTDQQSHQPKDGLADHLEKYFGWEEGRFEAQVEWIRVGVTEEDLRNVPARARVNVKDDYVDDDGKPKRGDPRAERYRAEHGEYGAEVEALEVVKRGMLAKRLKAEIHRYIIVAGGVPSWRASMRQERHEREL